MCSTRFHSPARAIPITRKRRWILRCLPAAGQREAQDWSRRRRRRRRPGPPRTVSGATATAGVDVFAYAYAYAMATAVDRSRRSPAARWWCRRMLPFRSVLSCSSTGTVPLQSCPVPWRGSIDPSISRTPWMDMDHGHS
ncbi:hypothetical protein SEVIR_4G275050v4 [Setaria viridis]